MYHPGMLKVSPNSGFSQFKKPQNVGEDRNNENGGNSQE
jgi:hypothetical protein